VITPLLKKNATVKAIATLAPSSRRGRVRNPIDYTEVRRALEAGHKSRIDWITDEEIVDAGKQLLKLKRVGIQCEKKMDFANSGKIAYKLRDFVSEIRKTTKSVLDR